MDGWLKQSTAVTIKIGPFLDSTDGNTDETGLTISQADVRLSKNGGNMAQKNESTACTHDELGVYDCPLDTTDTGTLGRLQIYVHESGGLSVWHTFMVVPANVWDSLFGADYLQTHAVEITNGLITAAAIATGAIDADAIADGAIDAGAIAADAITAAKIADGAIDAATFAAGAITASAIAADAIGASELAADAASEIGTAVWATAARTLTAATNVTSTGAAVPITAGGLVSSDVTAISTDTTAANNAESFFDGTGYAGTNNVIPSVTTVTGNVNGSVGSVAGAVGSVTGNVGGNVTGSVGSVVGAVGSVTGNVGGNVTGSVGSVAAGGITAASIANAAIDAATFAADVDAEIAAMVWNAAAASYGGAGTYGQAVEDILVDTGTTLQAELDGIQADTEDLQTQIGVAGAGLTAVPWNAAWDAEVQSEVFDALDAAFTDATVLTANGLLDRMRTLLWIQRNKMEVVDADGEVTVYKDDSATTAFNVATAVTDDSTTTTRLRIA